MTQKKQKMKPKLNNFTQSVMNFMITKYAENFRIIQKKTTAMEILL